MITEPASTRSGVRRPARCSIEVPGNGAKIGIAVASGARLFRRRRHCVDSSELGPEQEHDDDEARAGDDERDSRARGGRSARVPGRRRFRPRRSQSIWITPKTRARISSGTARWTRVKRGDVRRASCRYRAARRERKALHGEMGWPETQDCERVGSPQRTTKPSMNAGLRRSHTGPARGREMHADESAETDRRASR